MKVQFIKCLYDLSFQVLDNKSLPTIGLQGLLRTFTVLAFIFRSMIHFGLIFVYGMKNRQCIFRVYY